MKYILLFLITLCLSSNSLASDLCQTKMENAAIYELAQKEGKSVLGTKIIRFDLGSWAEALDDNSGSGQIAIAYEYGAEKHYFDVFAKRVGTSDDCNVTKVTPLDPKTIDPIALQAERYKEEIGDAYYMSEVDVTWSTFYSKTSVDVGFPLEQVKIALNSGSKIIEVWSHKEVLETLDAYIYEDLVEAESYEALKQILLKDFKELRVFKVGKSDSGSLDLYLVGRNKDGRLVGLKTITVERQ